MGKAACYWKRDQLQGIWQQWRLDWAQHWQLYRPFHFRLCHHVPASSRTQYYVCRFHQIASCSLSEFYRRVHPPLSLRLSTDWESQNKWLFLNFLTTSRVENSKYVIVLITYQQVTWCAWAMPNCLSKRFNVTLQASVTWYTTNLEARDLAGRAQKAISAH